MAVNLYVGNLSYDVDDAALRQLFTAFGNVESAKVIVDRYSGQSKGFGFVEMSNSDEAKAAIAGLDGTEAGGRKIKVNEAKPREGGGQGGGGRGGKGGFSRGGGGGGGGGGRRERY